MKKKSISKIKDEIKKKKKSNKKGEGFTLIELLAVIVILGLLMAIAIPSITQYITESRKKTIVSTIGNYITAMVNEVNDLTYSFTGSNTVYAVPIECIALERGGTSPLGEWHQANDKYWAYVLIQYDEENSSYTYGYTFKDSSGYGIYPTMQSKLNTQGKQIQTKLDLSKPQTGKVTTITSVDNWDGFEVDSSTELVVLEATSEGEVGNGKTTCTLCQKGNNYEQVEQEKLTRPQLLTTLIKTHNTLITAKPTLTNSSNNTSDASGLYSSTATTNEKATYYFRGNVKNNYVVFADKTWKIIRINEDGTIRLILDGIIGTSPYNTSSRGNDEMYYSGGFQRSKTQVDSWYKTNIKDKGYDSYVATTTFCEQAKVYASPDGKNDTSTLVIYTAYTPNFKCSADGNGKGILDSKVGLITYEEVVHAGGYYGKVNSNYYLYNKNYRIWTMSPAGSGTINGYLWYITSGGLYNYVASSSNDISPVINLNADVLATGNGEVDTPYVIQTN